ncbi:MAG: TetR/AcrR family transcriptional regulator [Syntrophobacteraceae bacterium]
MARKILFKDLKENEKRIRRDLIMDAAERVFAKTAFDRVQIRQIASEVGLTPGAIYTYFPDLETLFLETAIRGAERIRNSLDEVLETGQKDLGSVAVRYIEFIMDHLEYLRMSQHCLLYSRITSAEILERVNETSRSLFERFDQVLSSHVAGKEVRLYTHLLFSALNGILFTFGRYPNRSREEAMAHAKNLARLLVDLIEKRGEAGHESDRSAGVVDPNSA